jgi:hypothetical protein
MFIPFEETKLKVRTIYDGSRHCGTGDRGCPVVELRRGVVTIRDTKVPQRGSFIMSPKELLVMLDHAEDIKRDLLG